MGYWSGRISNKIVLKLCHTSDSSSIIFVAIQTKTLYFINLTISYVLCVCKRGCSGDFSSFSKMNDGITTTTFFDFFFFSKEAH